MTAKKFNAVEMKRRGSQRIYAQTKGLSRPEELAYWQQRDNELRQEQGRARRSKPKQRAG